MTHLCAQRGVKVRRVFLLTANDEKGDYFWEILQAQIELENAQTTGCLQTRFLFLSADDFTRNVEIGNHCGYWISGDEVMDIMPIYDLQDQLRSIRLLHSDVLPPVVRRKFDKYFKPAEPLTLKALNKHLKSKRKH
jgi:hypothetical protein